MEGNDPFPWLFYFIWFFYNVVSLRFVMQLLDNQKSLAQEKPHILISWLSLVALEDICEFVTLFKIAPEYVIQSLLYRFIEYEQKQDSSRVLEVSMQL